MHSLTLSGRARNILSKFFHRYKCKISLEYKNFSSNRSICLTFPPTMPNSFFFFFFFFFFSRQTPNVKNHQVCNGVRILIFQVNDLGSKSFKLISLYNGTSTENRPISTY